MKAPETSGNGGGPLDAALWTGAWSGILLPVLSHCGYAPIGAVYISCVSLAVLLGLTSHLLSRLRWLRAVLLMLGLVLMTSLYYGGLLAESVVSNLAYQAVLAACIFPCLRMPQVMLRVLGVVGGLQVLVAAFFTTPAILHEGHNPQLVRGHSCKPVVHVLLDEHTGLDSFPWDADHSGGIARLKQMYVSRGFTVFTKAYTSEPETYQSVTRFFNTSLGDYRGTVVYHGGRFHLTSGVDLKRIAVSRDIDATYTTYVDVHKVLQESGALVRERGYEYGLESEEASLRYQMSYPDRMRMAFWQAVDWFYRASKFPPLYHYFEEMRLGAGYKIAQSFVPPMKPYSLSGVLELDLFCERVSREATRGMYYYGHFLSPHHPFIFDEEGRLKVIADWRSRVVWPPRIANTMETRRDRYALHLEQALLCARRMGGLADALEDKFTRDGAVVIVHGDHGSRIGLWPYPEGYDKSDYDKDLRATFLALRIPGQTGGVVDRPVRIDLVLQQLIESDYEHFDLGSVPLTTDNPYAVPSSKGDLSSGQAVGSGF